MLNGITLACCNIDGFNIYLIQKKMGYTSMSRQHLKQELTHTSNSVQILQNSAAWVGLHTHTLCTNKIHELCA